MVLFVNKKTTDTPYVLVLDYDESLNEKTVLDAVQQSVKMCIRDRSHAVLPDKLERHFPIRLPCFDRENQGRKLGEVLAERE